MLVWAVYDISADRTRARVAKLCKRVGLHRVQKSVFMGKLEPSAYDELRVESAELIDPATDAVYFFELCPRDFDSVVMLGQRFDKELAGGTKRTLVI